MTKYNAPFIDFHRVDLQQALYQRAKELGVVFVMDQRVSKVNLSGSRPVVHTKSGSSFNGDLVVAADGLWSATRESFLGNAQVLPKPTGDLAYRIVLTLDQVADEPELQRWIKNPEVHFWIGPGSHVVSYSLRGGTMLNIVLLVPDNLPEGVAKQEGSLEEMRELFKGWDPILNKFLTKVEKVDKWKLMHQAELPGWVNDRSTLVLIGDSAHPMLPYLAQGMYELQVFGCVRCADHTLGANSSIEDGAVLGELLGAITSKAQLPQALRLYESLRKARGEAIVRETFKQRHDFHLPDGEEQEARDTIFRSQLEKQSVQGAFPSRWTCPEVQPWLYGYDAIKEVHEALKREAW
jgi:salicylate hydroxylase